MSGKRAQQHRGEAAEAVQPPESTPGVEAFLDRVRARLEAGSATYGDRSFSRRPQELLEEVAEELEDVCGWSFILWSRLQAMRAALEEAEPAIAEAAGTAAGARTGAKLDGWKAVVCHIEERWGMRRHQRTVERWHTRRDHDPLPARRVRRMVVVDADELDAWVSRQLGLKRLRP